MHTLLAPLLGLLLSAALAAATTTTTTITLQIPPTHLLPNPRALAPSTHATLSCLGVSASAPLTVSNAFVFRNVSAGSYLLDVHCPTHAFSPLRVDVVPSAPAPAPAHEGEGEGEVRRGGGLQVSAWETYRGNDWDNKGEAVKVRKGALEVRVVGTKAYFMERPKFNILSILKNPMILLGLVSMAIFIGMPYLVDNMDPEMREEWEKNQKNNPMNSLLSGGGQQGQNPISGFDMAAYLAGSKSKKDDGGNGGPSGSAVARREKGVRR